MEQEVLSSSVGEMAKESGGFIVDLDLVPLKYQGLTTLGNMDFRITRTNDYGCDQAKIKIK